MHASYRNPPHPILSCLPVSYPILSNLAYYLAHLVLSGSSYLFWLTLPYLIHLFFHLYKSIIIYPVYLIYPIHLSIHLSVFSFCLSACLSGVSDLSVYLSVRLCVYVLFFVYTFVYLSIVYLSGALPTNSHQSNILPIYHSIYVHIHIDMRNYPYLPLYLYLLSNLFFLFSGMPFHTLQVNSILFCHVIPFHLILF